jgi:hypothetical protein
MSYRMISYACTDCGTPTNRKRKTSDPKICISCGVDRLILNSIMMHFHAGTGYGKWQESRGPYGRPRKN